jgi:hypothetical protein
MLPTSVTRSNPFDANTADHAATRGDLSTHLTADSHISTASRRNRTEGRLPRMAGVHTQCSGAFVMNRTLSNNDDGPVLMWKQAVPGAGLASHRLRNHPFGETAVSRRGL